MSLKRKYQFYSKIVIFQLILFLYQIFFPTIGYALTSGPSQPEFQSFEPATTTDMVDIFSGDFNYNIPLFELPGPNGGYPFNLAYHAGIGMDQEASWVGLGWDLNVGAMNRSMRGIPDEFNGDLGDNIVKKDDIKPNITVGLNLVPGNTEGLGFDLVSLGSVSLFYNNYKGIGYSIGFGIDVMGMMSMGKGSSPVGLGVDISMNTQEGVDISPNLSLSMESKKGDKFNASFGMNFNSLQGYKGLNFNSSMSIAKAEKLNNYLGGYTAKGGFSFGNQLIPTVVPSVNKEMRGVSIDLTFKPGAEVFGSAISPEIGGYFKEEYLKDRNENIEYKAYGYNNSKYYTGDGMMDFNRENDGSVNKYANSLPIPNYTNDTWAVLGQGIGQMIRSHKTEVGYVYDNPALNFTGSGEFGLDLSFGSVTHVGVNIGYTDSRSKGNYWEGGDFSNKYTNNPMRPINAPYSHEDYYYRSMGEFNTMSEQEFENIGKTEAMNPKFTSNTSSVTKDYILNGKYITKSRNEINDLLNQTDRRKKRINPILEVKNEVLRNNPQTLKEFYVKYYNGVVSNFSNNPNPNTEYNRVDEKNHHLAGFIANNADGTRYVYALPAMNLSQTEKTFSVSPPINQNCENRIYKSTNVDGYYKVALTNNYLSETTIPKYPHSFLLTAVLGSDYIDVTGDGITEDDLGYWVKFNYAKASTEYKWRVPFKGFNYSQGMASTVSDDMASCTYGKRENWYIQSVETKTHVARFFLTTREDARSASENNDEDTNDKGVVAMYKLDKIMLYTRNELQNTNPIPIKTMSFNYDYTLCNNIDNGNDGKLTLKSVSFKYRGNNRSEDNKYIFDYNNLGSGVFNADYNSYNQDCWGVFKDEQSNMCSAKFPYVNQVPNSTHTIQQFKQIKDANASMWCLRKITLPSGASIKIEYESDDYAYVQNKPAMQLVKMVNKPSSSNNGKFDLIDRRLYFKLIKQMPSGLTSQQQKQELWKYIDKNKLVYFKAKIDLLKDEKDYEYVAGYAEVKDIGLTIEDPSVAYIELEKYKVSDKTFDNNPIQVAAWNCLQLNRPDLIGTPKNAFPTSGDPTKDEKRAMLLSLIQPFKGLAFLLRGFYTVCNERNYGKKIDLAHSYIRLNSLNSRTEGNKTIQNFKYGGGHRVKSIVIKENDNNTNSDEYGITYDYTIAENGIITSSGVATSEPNIGGEENSLRTPLQYEVNVKLKANYKLYSELPFNESLFPSPSVGYRKVTVHSLATQKVLDKLAGGNGLPVTVPTTGETVYSFYTAKDFPVITSYTDLSKSKIASSRPFTFYMYFFSWSRDYYYATQGYSIELNDMHGKPKGVEYFPISKSGTIINKPISATYYTYKSKPLSDINGYQANQLINEHIAVNGPNGESEKIVGINYDIINDLRQNVSKTNGGAAHINLDIIWPVPPAITGSGFAIINCSESVTKTAVTNKIIYRTGILDKTTQITDGSTITTTTDVFDELTGQALVQTINNEFGDKIQNIIHPAYWEYTAMGASYKNIGITFPVTFDANLTSSQPPSNNKYIVFKLPANYKNDEDFISNGDELQIRVNSSLKVRGIVMAKKIDNNGTSIIKVDVLDKTLFTNEDNKTYSCYIYRSGMRNQLNASVGNISKLIR